MNLQRTPKDQIATCVLHAKVDGVMARVMQGLKLPVPDFIRRDEVMVIVHTERGHGYRGSSHHGGGGGDVEVFVEVISTQGRELPVPMIADASWRYVHHAQSTSSQGSMPQPQPELKRRRGPEGLLGESVGGGDTDYRGLLPPSSGWQPVLWGSKGGRAVPRRRPQGTTSGGRSPRLPGCFRFTIDGREGSDGLDPNPSDEDQLDLPPPAGHHRRRRRRRGVEMRIALHHSANVQSSVTLTFDLLLLLRAEKKTPEKETEPEMEVEIETETETETDTGTGTGTGTETETEAETAGLSVERAWGDIWFDRGLPCLPRSTHERDAVPKPAPLTPHHRPKRAKVEQDHDPDEVDDARLDRERERDLYDVSGVRVGCVGRGARVRRPAREQVLRVASGCLAEQVKRHYYYYHGRVGPFCRGTEGVVPVDAEWQTTFLYRRALLVSFVTQHQTYHTLTKTETETKTKTATKTATKTKTETKMEMEMETAAVTPREASTLDWTHI